MPTIPTGAEEMARLVHARSLLFARTAVRWPGGRAPEEEAILAALHDFPILLTGDRAYLETEAGQAAALFAANQLARLFPAVRVELPAGIRLRVPQPLGTGACTLHDAAAATAAAVYPWGSCGVGEEVDAPPARGVLVLGSATPDALPASAFARCASGDGWMVRVEAPGAGGRIPTSANPLGALVSVAFAGVELYKAFLRGLVSTGTAADDGGWWDLAPGDDFVLSLLDYGRAETGCEYEPLPAGLDLGEVVFVSAGAMAHCTLYGLLAAGVRGNGTVAEPKDLDEPDLNRYVLAAAADLEAGKARLFADHAAPSIRLQWEAVRYQDSEGRARFRTEGRRVPLMLVGVDHPPSRIEAQNDDPEVLINGATERGEICVSRHASADPDLACLACITPDEEVVGTIPTLGPVSAVAGLLLAGEAVKERVPGLARWRLPGAVRVSALRADAPHGVRLWSPGPSEGCACRTRRLAPAAGETGGAA
jgi:molybdopterin/thiamine biosynthesis adenylyltransferase